MKDLKDKWSTARERSIKQYEADMAEWLAYQFQEVPGIIRSPRLLNVEEYEADMAEWFAYQFQQGAGKISGPRSLNEDIPVIINSPLEDWEEISLLDQELVHEVLDMKLERQRDAYYLAQKKLQVLQELAQERMRQEYDLRLEKQRAEQDLALEKQRAEQNLALEKQRAEQDLKAAKQCAIECQGATHKLEKEKMRLEKEKMRLEFNLKLEKQRAEQQLERERLRAQKPRASVEIVNGVKQALAHIIGKKSNKLNQKEAECGMER